MQNIENLKIKQPQNTITQFIKKIKKIVFPQLVKYNNSLNYDDLSNQIKKCNEDLSILLNNYQQAVDNKIIDCIIYEIKAVNLKHSYLLKKVKSMNKIA